jgi:radical SAM superfamily enzyme YgiQ (UPF0313 family)
MRLVLFVQLPPPRFSFEDAPTNIPLAAGFLMSALEVTRKTEFIAEALDPDITDVFADEGLLAKILEKQPSAVAFTLYVWNVEKSLFLASNIKRHLPGVYILVGGPEVTPDNRWVLEHPAVDAGIFGEGESRVGELLEVILGEPSLCKEGSPNPPPRNSNMRLKARFSHEKADFQPHDRSPLKRVRGNTAYSEDVLDSLLFERLTAQIPGCFYKLGGRVMVNSDPAPPWDLAACPYPYLDEAIKPSRDGTLFLETVRGCPFKCRYCYYHKTFAGLRYHPDDSLEKVLDFAYSPDSDVREIYLMDPTFNARKGFREILKSMAVRRRYKDLALHTELRADLLSADDVRLLADAGLKSAEIGLQSVNPVALRIAGRTGDPEKIAIGVSLLKEAGIDVTTGVILGLPGDSPQQFRGTLSWLKDSGAYSVVHPFVLSILPGTDFRRAASELKLTYDPRPPYNVISTPTFPEADFRPALLQCEEVFDIELDYIPPPSLVDRAAEMVTAPAQARFISKWIVDPGKRAASGMLGQVIPRATDPFTFWFRGAYDEKVMLELLCEFVQANPHAVVHVVLEFRDPPRVSFLREALEVAAHPDLYLNRSYRPLFGENAVVSVNFTVIMPDPGSSRARSKLAEMYEPLALVVWETTETAEERLATMELPLLISWPSADPTWYGPIMKMLVSVFGDHPEEVLFRDQLCARQWTALTKNENPKAKLGEAILY